MSEIDSFEGVAPESGPEVAHDQPLSEQIAPQNDSDAAKESNEQSAQEINKLIKKFKLKVDGEEIEEEYDLSNEEQLVRDLQLARAAKKRMAEAQDAKKKAFDLVSQFDKDPATLLKRLGPKGIEIAESMLLEQLQMQQMTPEQRRMMELEQQLKQYQEQEQMAKQQAEEERMAQLEAQQAQVLQSKIIDGLKAANAPTTPEAVKRMAAIYLKNLELGLELEVSDLADEYKAEVQGYLNNTFKGADIDQLIAMFGTDVINKIRKYDLQKMNEKNKLKQTKVESRVPNPPKKGKDYETTEEWLERMRSKKFDD